MPAVSAAHRRARRRFVAGLASLLAARAGHPQGKDSPAPVTLIIPAFRGTSSDRIGRMIAEGLSRILEAPVGISNIAGDAGVTGTNAIAAGARDGTLLGLAISSAMIGGKLLSRAATFKPVDDFRWFAILGTFPAAMVIAGRSPHRDVREWVAAAHEAPSPWIYASVGTGSAGHLAGAYLRIEHGANLVHRSVESSEERYSLLDGGAVDLIFDGAPSAAIEAPRAGHRVIAVTSADRQIALSDVPSFGELWQQSFDTWVGLVAPKGLDDAAYARLSAAVGVLLSASDTEERLRAAGMSYTGLSGGRAIAYFESEFLRTAKVIALLNEAGQRN
jgi:tripartite-type tricarboxylate transporter receptor subunit TctC